jgi:F0F1-type ATP synthase alpha subunit
MIQNYCTMEEVTESMLTCCSDGIARVHGMANVQAEELVE